LPAIDKALGLIPSIDIHIFPGYKLESMNGVDDFTAVTASGALHSEETLIIGESQINVDR